MNPALLVQNSLTPAMGEYFLIVNPAKRQYLDICNFGENCKASGYMYGLHAAAVGILCCEPAEVRFGSGEPRHDFGPLAGSWSGDPVRAAGDEQEPVGRNLHAVAKAEFEDITEAVVAMMCNGHEEYARQFAERLDPGSSDWVLFGRVATERKVPNLEAALTERFGAGWREIYEGARRKNWWRE